MCQYSNLFSKYYFDACIGHIFLGINDSSVDWLWVGSAFEMSIDSISVYICLHILYGDTLIFLEYMTEKEFPIHMKTLCSTFQGSASLLS